MHEPVRIQVVWNEPDIELRLMKALIAVTEVAQRPLLGRPIDLAALKRVGDWYRDRCNDEVEAANG